MVVFECADKLTRLYSMSVYCLEYRQAEAVTIWGAFHIRGKSELHALDEKMDQYQYTRVLETKMLPFATRDFQAKCVFSKMTMLQHSERDASWISSKMRMCSTWIGLLCHRI
jgi:hypothetical protein